MKIGIVLHSYTGNTYSVAQKLGEKLASDGHDVEMHRLKLPEGWKPNSKEISFEYLPDLSEYDGLIFGSPVAGFSLSPVMKTYFSKLGLLKGKKTGLIVTHHFPFPWMGGKGSLKEMEKTCGEKGADIVGSCIIDWSSRKREQQIRECVIKFSRAFGS